jgi:ATP-dependent Clp protease protease subunit
MNRLLRLLADNRSLPHGEGQLRRFEVKNATADEATVYVYDAIVSSQLEADFWGGVAAEPFVRAFNDISAPLIHLRINSPGGDVFAARAMETAVRQHKSAVLVHIDGYAASAASILAMAGDEIEIADGGCIMIHNSWSLAMGNAADMRKTADLLEQVDASIVATFVKRSGMDAKDIAQLMTDETWIFAEDAVAGKWADRIAPDSAEAKLNWNIAALLDKPKTPTPERVPVPDTESRVAAERKQRHYERIAA